MSNVVSIEDHRPKPQPGGNKKGTRRRFGNMRKLPSGRWQASYQAPDGQRVNAPTTFERKGDASAWLDMQSGAITEGRWKPQTDTKAVPRFDEYAEAWLKGRELKPRTKTEYGRLLTALVEHFGYLTLDAITAESVRKWYATLDPTFPTRRAHRYSLLRTIMNSAIEDELIEVNPCRIRGAGQAKRVHEIKIASREEVATMVNALPDRYKLMLLLTYGCGFRFGELTELRRRDVELTEQDGALVDGTVSIRRGVTWVRGKPVVGTPKSHAGLRTVHVPPHMLGELRAHINGHAQEGPDGLLFTSMTGDNHLNHGTWRKSFETARSAAGREDLHFHDIRHTCFVNLAIAGATTRELMYVAGHTTPTMAMRYQHVAESRLPELAKRMSRLIEGEV